jgi:DNA polymerase (family 10)
MDNLDIAKIFEEVADLLDVENENPFRVRAYRNAARTLESLEQPVASLIASAPAAERAAVLAELPAIGKDLAGKILEILQTGDLGLRKELATEVPQSVAELVRIGGVGPKRARQIWEELGVTTVEALEEAARSGALQNLHGIGPRLQAQILKGCTEHKARARRCLLFEADAQARALLSHLQGAPGLLHLEVAGSYRRRQETVGDLDLLATAEAGHALAERFVSYPEFREILARGDTKCAAVLRSGLQVDLRIVPPESAGAALQYFTGSKAHGIAVRTRAQQQGFKLNEYGLFRGARRIAGRTEEEVYRALGLAFIPPELREDRGEIAAAEAKELPRLVSRDDLRGDLHMHTRYSDGQNTVREMALCCQALGYKYLAITDHTQSLRVAGGIDAASFRRQAREIDALRSELQNLAILKGAEVDILADGMLDLDDSALAELDLVLVSIHSRFKMSKEDMTARVLRALRNPRVHIFTHPTGRLLGRREPYAIDMLQVVRAARDLGVWLEVNSQPERLDLTDLHIRMARDEGAKLCISTDAHRTQELCNMGYGVDQARRGWCRKEDVVNTLPLAAFKKLLAARAPRKTPHTVSPSASL